MRIGTIISKFLKKLLPRRIKVLILRIQQRYFDFILSLTKEVPLIGIGNRSKGENSESAKRYDCFYFFDELEILELRLNILNDYVDYFVICEATKTFSGKEKSLVFQENRHRFEKFLHKIIYVPLEWSPSTRDEVREFLHRDIGILERMIAMRTLTSKNVPVTDGESVWLTEYFQKESMHLALKYCNNEDIIYISDVDEIWNPTRQFTINNDRIYIFRQVAYIYFLNNKSNEHWHSWTGSIVARYSQIKDRSINEIRTHGRIKRYVISKGGWHFSFQGGTDRIIHKLNSYGHQELNVPEVIGNVQNLVSTRKDMRGRAVKYRKNNKGLPKYLIDNFGNYSEMLL